MINENHIPSNISKDSDQTIIDLEDGRRIIFQSDVISDILRELVENNMGKISRDGIVVTVSVFSNKHNSRIDSFVLRIELPSDELILWNNWAVRFINNISGLQNPEDEIKDFLESNLYKTEVVRNDDSTVIYGPDDDTTELEQEHILKVFLNSVDSKGVTKTIHNGKIVYSSVSNDNNPEPGCIMCPYHVPYEGRESMVMSSASWKIVICSSCYIDFFTEYTSLDAPELVSRSI